MSKRAVRLRVVAALLALVTVGLAVVVAGLFVAKTTRAQEGTGSISGVVTHEVGNLIAGGQVWASDDGCCGWGFASTDAGGACTISDLPVGQYRVWAEAEGWPADDVVAHQG